MNFREKGFTLVELLVTVTLLAIVASISIPIYFGYKKEAQTQEAYLQLNQIADSCISKAVKSVETNSPTTSFSLAALQAGKFFDYDTTPSCARGGGTFTATGKAGLVAGDTLTVTVTMSGTDAAKVWGGNLY